MLAAALKRVRDFLSSGQNLLALATLPALGAWIYSRVWMINPAILGDEYLYSMNARKGSPWDPPIAGDFSNYLFNLAYSSTNLCGSEFYTCAKVLNITFFLGFTFTLFLIGSKFLPFWGAYLFMIGAGLSSLNIYTSMFLPESMFFFFIGLVLVLTLRAINIFSSRSWLYVGALVGASSLVKPHAWITAIAVGITILVIGLTNKSIGLRTTLFSAIALLTGAISGRIVLGFLAGGPQTLSFFGQYVNLNVVSSVSEERPTFNGLEQTGTITPIQGVAELFLPQLGTHILVVVALTSVVIVSVFGTLGKIISTRNLTPARAFVLFVAIWTGVMVVSIVIFTGWVTGTGDDHSTRVLLRYYDFMFPVLALAGVVGLHRGGSAEIKVQWRWLLALTVASLMSPAFSGFFGTLTIQIADAPYLAGLVVNLEVLNGVAILGMFAVLTFATFPQFAIYSLSAFLAVTFIFVGWQTQDQYQIARGEDKPFDVAGKWLRANFSENDFQKLGVLASSRFNATALSLWADADTQLPYELYLPESLMDTRSGLKEVSYVVALDGIKVANSSAIIHQEDGFAVHKVDQGS